MVEEISTLSKKRRSLSPFKTGLKGGFISLLLIISQSIPLKNSWAFILAAVFNLRSGYEKIYDVILKQMYIYIRLLRFYEASHEVVRTPPMKNIVLVHMVP